MGALYISAALQTAKIAHLSICTLKVCRIIKNEPVGRRLHNAANYASITNNNKYDLISPLLVRRTNEQTKALEDSRRGGHSKTQVLLNGISSFILGEGIDLCTIETTQARIERRAEAVIHKSHALITSS